MPAGRDLDQRGGARSTPSVPAAGKAREVEFVGPRKSGSHAMGPCYCVGAGGLVWAAGTGKLEACAFTPPSSGWPFPGWTPNAPTPSVSGPSGSSHTSGAGKVLQRFTAPAASLQTTAFGLTFPSPFGLAAGFDKEGHGIEALTELGFGHVEVGTITGQAQPGNEKPRLFRLVQDRAVINRMGFNNDGAAAVAPRLKAARAALQRRHPAVRPVIGVNIGKTKVVELDDAVADYLVSARSLAPAADYLVVNVSSPNTPGLRLLQDVETLRPLLTAVGEEADTGRRPARSAAGEDRPGPERRGHRRRRAAGARPQAGRHHRHQHHHRPLGPRLRPGQGGATAVPADCPALR